MDFDLENEITTKLIFWVICWKKGNTTRKILTSPGIQSTAW
ncbi:MAG: hypothetical protein R2883_06890 [Caldisericia bacterium]